MKSVKATGPKAGDRVSLPHQIGWPVGFPEELAPGLGKPLQNPCYIKKRQIGIVEEGRPAEEASLVVDEEAPPGTVQSWQQHRV